jgi:hypothetical protein
LGCCFPILALLIREQRIGAREGDGGEAGEERGGDEDFGCFHGDDEL